jgi:hypothetical protein
MALIGNDFIKRPATRSCYCSECGKKIRKGEPELVSIRRGKVRKRVCSEECRLEFDSAIWQEFADKNEGRG